MPPSLHSLCGHDVLVFEVVFQVCELQARSPTKSIIPLQQICDFSPHSLCNKSNSSPPRSLRIPPLLTSLSSSSFSPSAFTFCSPPVREQILSPPLSAWHFQSVLQQIKCWHFPLIFMSYFPPTPHLSRCTWQRETNKPGHHQGSKSERLKVWHLNAEPGGSILAHEHVFLFTQMPSVRFWLYFSVRMSGDICAWAFVTLNKWLTLLVLSHIWHTGLTGFWVLLRSRCSCLIPL